MVRELHFASQNYRFLTEILSTFHFVTRTTETAEKLKKKACLWDKRLAGNLYTVASKSMHILALGVLPTHVN